MMNGKIESIQFLRFVAATLVALFHSTLAIEKFFAGNLPPLFLRISNLGAAGVDIFFVISGFIMIITSFSDSREPFSPRRFLARRAIRIYPIYFIYSAFYLVFYDLFATGKDVSLLQVLGSLFLLPGFSSYIIGPGWTLSFEIYFYACFAVAMMFGLRNGILALSLFFFLAVASSFVVHSDNSLIHVMTSNLLLEFLLGAWIAYAILSKRQFSSAVAIAAVFGACVWFLASLLFLHSPALLRWGIPSALLVCGLASLEKNTRLPSIVSKCSFLGDSSYSLYLLHILLIDVFIFLAIYFDATIASHIKLIGSIGTMTLCLAITAYCVLVAVFSYDMLERRVITYFKKVLRAT